MRAVYSAQILKCNGYTRLRYARTVDSSIRAAHSIVSTEQVNDLFLLPKNNHFPYIYIYIQQRKEK